MKIKRYYLQHLFFASSVIGLGISYSKIYLFHISLILLNLFTYIQINMNYNSYLKRVKLPNKLHYIFFAMLIWYSISIMWSINTQYWLEYLFYIVCGTSISLNIVYYSHNFNNYKKQFNTISFFFILQIIVCLFETFTSFRLPTSPYSKYRSFFGRSQADLSNFSDTAQAYISSSPTGFHGNPNNLATAMSIIFPFFLFHTNKYIKILGIISIIIIVTATGSRGNMISICLMFLVHFLYSYKKFFIGIFLLPFTFIITPIITSIIKFFGNSENIKLKELLSLPTVLSNTLFQKASSVSSIGVRKQLINNGIEAFLQTHGLGLGGGGARAIQEQIGGVVGKISSLHNFWIEILIEGGILFAVCFSIWYIYMIYSLYKISLKTRKDEIKYYASSTSLSMIGFLIGATSPSTCIYLFPMWILFGFAIATINNFQKLNEKNTFRLYSRKSYSFK